MKIAQTIIMLLVLVIVASCSSSHNIKKDGENSLGGGYMVGNKVRGRVPITAKTNYAPWENYGSARSMWAKHAKQTCGHSNYTEEDVKEYIYEQIPEYNGLKYIVTVKEGVAVCKK